MKLPISLGIKPALITAAVLLAVIAALLFNLRLANAAADTALANQGKAEAARDAAITERDAWKSKAGDALAANEAFDAIFEKQRLAAAEQQRHRLFAALRGQLGFQLAHKARVARERRASGPGHMHAAWHMADKLALFGRAHVHQHGVARLQQLPGLRWRDAAGIAQFVPLRVLPGRVQHGGQGDFGSAHRYSLFNIWWV